MGSGKRPTYADEEFEQSTRQVVFYVGGRLNGLISEWGSNCPMTDDYVLHEIHIGGHTPVLLGVGDLRTVRAFKSFVDDYVHKKLRQIFNEFIEVRSGDTSPRTPENQAG